MEKFEPNNIEPINKSVEGNVDQKIEAEGEAVKGEFEDLGNKIKTIESLNLPKEQEKRVMRKVITKLEMIQAATVGLSGGFGIILAMQKAAEDPSPANTIMVVTIMATAWVAHFTTSLSSIDRNRKDYPGA